MKKVCVIFALVLFLLVGSAIAEEKEGIRPLAYPEFEKELKKGGVGRFQPVRLDNMTILVIDTKEGHLWLWGVSKEQAGLIYQGKLLPGRFMGDIIHRNEFQKKKWGD